jgi:signal transduction histidine kinase
MKKANFTGAALLLLINIAADLVFVLNDVVYYLSPLLFSLFVICFAAALLFRSCDSKPYRCAVALYLLYTIYFAAMSMVFFGPDSGIHYYHAVIALMPLISFRIERWYVIFPLMFVNVVLFIAAEIFGNITGVALQMPCDANILTIIHFSVIFVIYGLALIVDRYHISTDKERLKEMSLELKRKNDELEKSLKTKDSFFSIIAHDLKAPIGNFSNFLDMMSDSGISLSDEEMKSALKLLRDSSKNTYNLLDNILTWARLNLGEIQFEPVETDLCCIVRKNIDLFTPAAVKKGIEIEFSSGNDEVKMHADVNMVDAVVRNLLNNALKYSYPGGIVRISCKVSGSRASLVFEDEGAGMEGHTIRDLFRLDVKHYSQSGTSGEGGSGLGLVMCKEFVDFHNGTIEVSSKKGEGSKFTVTLDC